MKFATLKSAALGIAALVASGAPFPASAADLRDFRLSIVFDHDADFDDTAALAALAAAHRAGRIDLRAVTVINNGAGLPGKAYRHTRCLLDQLGLANVPVADATYDLPNAFPDWLRLAFDGVLDDAIGDCAAGHVPASQSPRDLIADILAAAPGRVVLIATGPVTNLAEGFAELRERHGWPAAFAVRAAYVQGGGINMSEPEDPPLLPPEFDGSQAINTWVDAAAAETIHRALGPKLRLVADATADVPIRLDYIDNRLAAAQHTPATVYVVRLMNQPLLREGLIARGGTACCWWDPLAAISALRGVLDPIVSYRLLPITVIQDGPQEGRTVVSPAGRPILVGLSANRQRFEDTFLATLNGE
jgi:purine nucleosidase